MREHYTFPAGVNQIDDDHYRFTEELMVYTHIWESKPFLRQLFRLAFLSKKKSYPWQVEVPEMSKHEYIRFEIRDVLQNNGLSLADVISKGFHTSLRNAFAHSEYSFDDYHKAIFLDTYKGATWDIRSIAYDKWSQRFAYSSLFNYHFHVEKHVRRKALPTIFGKNEFYIIQPINARKFRATKIYYSEMYDSFGFHP